MGPIRQQVKHLYRVPQVEMEDLVGGEAVEGRDGLGCQQVIDRSADRAGPAVARGEPRGLEALCRTIGLGEEASLFRMRPEAQPRDDLVRRQHRAPPYRSVAEIARMRRSIAEERHAHCARDSRGARVTWRRLRQHDPGAAAQP